MSKPRSGSDRPPLLCQIHGFIDEEARRARLEMLKLHENDESLGQCLQEEVIRPNLTWIVSEFYRFMQDVPQMAPFLKGPGVLLQLKKTQERYLLSLGVDFGSAQYFEERLRVGVVHRRIGLPSSQYIAAYAELGQLVAAAVWQKYQGHVRKGLALTSFLSRVIALDMSLTLDTYHLTTLRQIERKKKDT